MENCAFPLDFEFKIATLHNDFTVKDANGNTLAYVRQKLLKLVDEVVVFEDESRAKEIYRIKADRWIDFSAVYTFTDKFGVEVGKIGRKGFASIWKANYEIFDRDRAPDLFIREENAWIKVADAILGEIPLLNFFTGYFLNPSYMLTRPDGNHVARLKKLPSFWGRKFRLEQLAPFEIGEEERMTLGMIMMILLERHRG
jgi:uncharacterized protein YxjI